MASVTINGVTYTGTSISVNGNQVVIDGNAVETAAAPVINIHVEGNVANLKVGSCGKLSVDGDVKDLALTTGSVSCLDVTGNVSLLTGSVTCHAVGGNVSVVTGKISKRVD